MKRAHKLVCLLAVVGSVLAVSAVHGMDQDEWRAAKGSKAVKKAWRAVARRKAAEEGVTGLQAKPERQISSAGVLPFIYIEKNILFLLGQDARTGHYSSFGGGHILADALQGAAQKGWYKTCGIFGTEADYATAIGATDCSIADDDYTLYLMDVSQAAACCVNYWQICIDIAKASKTYSQMKEPWARLFCSKSGATWLCWQELQLIMSGDADEVEQERKLHLSPKFVALLEANKQTIESYFTLVQ